MAYQQDFTYVTGTEPHRTRTREIVKAHPEVKKLITKNPMTFVWILGCVSMQIGMAYLVKDQAWWVILAAAWLIGAFPTHTLFVCIHEAAHNLIFKKPSWYVYAGIVANLPQAVISTFELGRQGALSAVVIVGILVMVALVPLGLGFTVTVTSYVVGFWHPLAVSV